MVFCLACGLVAPDAAKFCPACGAEIQITKPESSNGENLIHEALGNVADSPRPRSKAPLIWGVGTFLVVIVLIIAVLSGGGSNTDTTGGGSNTDTTSSNGSQYLTSQGQPSTSDLVSAFSSGLDLNINQEDVARGITFPSISKSVDVWSAPYFSLLIYPSADEQTADSTNFQSDYSSLNSSRSWESCQNFVVVFSPEMQSKVDSVVAKWCTSSSPSPASEAPSNSWYPSGYSEVSKGVAFKSLPLGSYLCDAGTICLEAYVEVKGGCSDSLYAEVNFLDSAGTIVDNGNHMSGVVPPKTPVLMTFSTTNPNAQTYKITTTNCYQR
jgi:hypothetical protein